MNRTLRLLGDIAYASQGYKDIDERIDLLPSNGVTTAFYAESLPNVRTSPKRTFAVPSYPFGEHVLEVYVSGVRVFNGVDYDEDSATQITFRYDIVQSHHVVFTVSASKALLSVGMIMWLSSTIPPDGWIKCNGALVDRVAYANLFAKIGEQFGAGDGSTTFAIPDLRGEFVRGWDDGRNIDSGRLFGTAQIDELKAHTHTITYFESTASTGDAEWQFDSGPGYQATFYQTTSVTGGVETRPRNIALMPCIKY